MIHNYMIDIFKKLYWDSAR